MYKFNEKLSVKEVLSEKEVARKYLGEPEKVIGKTYRYSSPFRNDVTSSTPFVVTDNYMIDNGGDFRGDGFRFVQKLFDLSPKEAWNKIIEDFNLDKSNLLASNQDLVEDVKREPKVEIVLEVGNEPQEIITMFDSEAFKKKPSSEETGGIKARIPNLKLTPYSLETIKNNILVGHTCIPSGMKTDAEKEFTQQQMFFIDIDNKINVDGTCKNLSVSDEQHITVEKVIEVCTELNLLPTFIYNTFSHTEECHKLRLVYVLEKPVTDVLMAKCIINILKEKLDCLNIDQAPTSVSSLFFGGVSIAYSSNIFYNPVERNTEDLEYSYKLTADYGKFNAYTKNLPSIGYAIARGKLAKALPVKRDKDGVERCEYNYLCNVLPVITEQITYDNGRDNYTEYVMEGVLLENAEFLPPINVTSDDIEKIKYFFSPEWQLKTIKEPNRYIDEDIRYVTQMVSRGLIKSSKVYSHTGFIRNEDGKLVYLYHGGFIGDGKNIKVDLSRDSLERYSMTEKEFDVKEALSTSYSILDVADRKITMPLLATTYLAPLTSLFSEEGMLPNYVLWLEGKTGSYKSSLAAVSQSHFGPFERDTFPCSFRDTTNSLEKKAFVLKDILNVIDDFNPETVGNAKVAVVEKVFAMYGDRLGRGRMCQDGKTLKAAYTARGVCLITGECFPEVAESRIARTIRIELKPDSIDFLKLVKLQRKSESLSFAMKKYIEWVIENENYIISQAKDIKEKIIDDLLKKNVKNHGRTNEAIIMITIGFYLFLKFLKENDVITESELKEQMTLCYSNLEELSIQQTSDIYKESPITMFKDAVEQLYATGKIEIINYSISCNVEAKDNLVGYIDYENGLYYFLPSITYAEVTKFYRKQGSKFPLPRKALEKCLEDEGFLYTTEKSDRRTIKRTNPNTGTQLPVWGIYQDKLEIELKKDNSVARKIQEEMREYCIKTQKAEKDTKSEN